MPILSQRDLADSYFYGCIRPGRRAPFEPRIAHGDYTFLTKELWRLESPPLFLKPEFFAVPGLGRLPSVERPVVLFGGFFLELEERFSAFLDEFEGILAHLHWRAVHAHLRSSRSGAFEFTWTAHDVADDASTSTWDFVGPRQIPLPASA